MKTFGHIVGLLFLFSVMSCGRMPQHASEADLQAAKAYYDSGFVCLQQDSMMRAFPYFIQVAEKLEYLPEDMTNEEKLLVSRAYYQIAYVLGRKMENNAEIDALRWALGYQNKIGDTMWITRSSLSLAHAFQNIMETDSARYYLDNVMPYMDTVSSEVWDYISARHLLADLYYDDHEMDSCIAVQHNIIAFKARRGMDTKWDSISLGMHLFFSEKKGEAKPYLQKVLELDFADVESGAILSLLGQIYEEDNKLDSAALLYKFSSPYVQAESERVSDGLLATKQFEQFKKEREIKQQYLREKKNIQIKLGKKLRWICIILLFFSGILLLSIRRKSTTHLEFTKSWTMFEKTDIFVKIKGRLANENLKVPTRNLESHPELVLDKTDFVALKNAVDSSFGGFASKLAEQYSDLNPIDIVCCNLSLMELSYAEMAMLLGVKYNAITNRVSRIRKIFGTEDGLSAYLTNLLKKG